MVFFSTNRKNVQRDLFIALETGNSHASDFISKCNSVDTETILSARDMRIGHEGRTLLHTAARLGYTSAIKFLIGVGHDIDPVDSSCTLVTPLLDAIACNHIRAACVLVEAGANLFHQDKRLENSLHTAARVGSRMVIGLIKLSKISQEKIKELASTPNAKHKFPEDLANFELTREVLYNFRTTGRHQPKPKKHLGSYEDILRNAKSAFDYRFVFSTDSDESNLNHLSL
eukprot:gene733-1409_t